MLDRDIAELLVDCELVGWKMICELVEEGKLNEMRFVKEDPVSALVAEVIWDVFCRLVGTTSDDIWVEELNDAEVNWGVCKLPWRLVGKLVEAELAIEAADDREDIK